jgi:hypothetical protein
VQPQREPARRAGARPGVTIASTAPQWLEVTGSTAQAIGEVATASQLVLHELTPVIGSLEDVALTQGSVEYHWTTTGRHPNHLGADGSRRPARKARPDEHHHLGLVDRDVRPWQPPDGGVRLTFPRVVKSEWIRFATLRSTVWTLASTVVVMVEIAAAFSELLASQGTQQGAPAPAFSCSPSRQAWPRSRSPCWVRPSSQASTPPE